MDAVTCAEATIEAVKTPEKPLVAPTKDFGASRPVLFGVIASADAAFDRLDANGDGVVDRAEWQRATQHSAGFPGATECAPNREVRQITIPFCTYRGRPRNLFPCAVQDARARAVEEVRRHREEATVAQHRMDQVRHTSPHAHRCTQIVAFRPIWALTLMVCAFRLSLSA